MDTLIPLLSLQLGSVQAAIDYSIEIVRSSIQKLEEAERLLLQEYSSNTKLYEELARFTTACKYACTGNLSWR